ncbi:hypothetical protein J4221_03450 [Candidatus Pacearchaeota archaeon]|nr:hypothetical protein [Candidatus Pacearchaeota archaeon]
MDIENTLQNLGLDEYEVKVYLSLIDYGDLTASQIADKSGIGRVNTYQIAERLINRGLVSFVFKKKVKHFLAVNPEKLLTQLHEKEKEFKKILPELKLRQKTANPDNAKVEIFRGKEGLNVILNMILDDKKPYFMFGGGEQCCSKDFELVMEVFVRKAEKQKLKGKLLERKNADFFIGKNEDYRLLPDEFFSSITNTFWDDKLAIIVWTKPYYAILIQNKEIVKSNISVFDYLWNLGEFPDKKDRNKRLLKD